MFTRYYLQIKEPYFDIPPSILNDSRFNLEQKPILTGEQYFNIPQSIFNDDRFKLAVNKESTENKQKPKKIDTNALMEATTRGVAQVLSSILGKQPPAMQAPGLGGHPVPFVPTQQIYPLRQEFKPMLGKILGR